MMNRVTKISFILLLFLTGNSGFADQLFSTRLIVLNNKPYQLEIADTDERRTQGLMNRKSLARDAGMLFVYPGPGDFRIWMKNTLIPLSVIWLDASARIIDMTVLQPCVTIHCPIASVHRPSQFILELHPAELERFKPGDQLAGILNLQPDR